MSSQPRVGIPLNWSWKLSRPNSGQEFHYWIIIKFSIETLPPIIRHPFLMTNDGTSFHNNSSSRMIHWRNLGTATSKLNSVIGVAVQFSKVASIFIWVAYTFFFNYEIYSKRNIWLCELKQFKLYHDKSCTEPVRTKQ